MLEHNSKIRELFITVEGGLFWNWPLYILEKIVGMEELSARRIITKYGRCYRSLIRWLGHKTWRKEYLCKRQLKYIGCHWCPEENKEDTFFKMGGVYTSKIFNGATYKIEGYCGYIGSAYFERLT